MILNSTWNFELRASAGFSGVGLTRDSARVVGPGSGSRVAPQRVYLTFAGLAPGARLDRGALGGPCFASAAGDIASGNEVPQVLHVARSSTKA